MKSTNSRPYRVVVALLVLAAMAVISSDIYRRNMIARRRELAAGLSDAVFRGKLGEVKRFVNAGADVNAATHGYTPLCTALWTGNLDCAYYLLRHGSKTDVDPTTGLGNLLYSASRIEARDAEHEAELVEVVRRLIHDGQEVNCRTDLGGSPVTSSSAFGDIAVTLELIKHGANINVSDYQGYSPLHYAALNDHPNVASLLLRSGANAQARNRRGETPLQLAISKKHSALVRILSANSKLGLHR